MSAAERRLRTPARTGRGNLWLAVVAVVQAGLLVLVLLTVARPPVTHTGPLLGKNVTTSDITAFTVTGSKGNSITLKRNGVNWVLPDQGGYPAENSRVKSFLQELTALQRTGLVATTKDAYKRLKVATDTYARKIDLTLKGGTKETLYIGSEPSYGSTHVRLASGKGVYVTHSLHASDARTDASGYVNTTVLKLDPANLTRIEIKNANGDFVFTKAAGGWSWQGLPSGKKLDSQTVTNMADALASLQLNEPLGKKVQASYGFAKPLAVVTLTTVKHVKASSGTSGSNAASTSTTSSKASGSSSTGSSSSGPSTATSGTATSSGTTTGGATATKPATQAASTTAAASTKTGSPKTGSTKTTTKTKTVTTQTTITVGAKDKAGFYPIRLSNSPYIVRVTSAALGGAIGKKASDFIAAPPKSSSSGTGASGGTSGLRPILPGTGGTSKP